MKKYYYHVTEQYWGEEKILKPRKKGHRRDTHEPDISRICVCPSIEDCLIAIYLYDMIEWNVYRTKYKVIAHKPKSIPDSKITNEHWIKKSTKFIYVGSVRGKLFEKIINQTDDFYHNNNLLIGDGSKKTLNYQKIVKNKLQKLIKENKILIKKLTKKELSDPIKINKKELNQIIKKLAKTNPKLAIKINISEIS